MKKVPAFTSSCLNCQAPLTGVFCAHCGQLHRHPRLRVRDWLIDSFNAIALLDSKVPNTLAGLIRHPGVLAREYVEGRRARYMNPLQFAVLTCALWWMAVALNPAASTEGLLQYLQFINLASLPLLALFQYLPLRAAGYNYAEHLVLMFYVSGFAFLWRMFLALTYVFDVPGLARLINYADSLAYIAYLSWALWQFNCGRVAWLPLRILGALIGVLFAGSLINLAVVLLNRA